MKRQLFAFALICLSAFAFGQETITGWTFPVNTGPDSLNANMGTEQNMGYDIRKEDAAGGEDNIYFTNGTLANDYAATAANWDNSADNKFWSIKFKMPGYKSFKLSSKQRSGGNTPGPRDWKVQFQFSGQDFWTDIPNGEIVCANDWETGILQNLPLPAECNNPAGSVYIRWIPTSNLDINGNVLVASGISKIDDIVVTGLPIIDADTLTGWTFPTGTETDLNANMGTEQNMGYDIRVEDDLAGTEGTITFTNGQVENDWAATAEGWNAGADHKFWSIKFKALDYRDFRVSSKQRSGGNKPGPRDWKLQYQLSGQDIWTDIPDGVVTCANDWTTAVIEDLPVPAEANYPESSVYIRWVMTSNTSINGADVLADGISKIDDILITGVSPTGIREKLNIEDVSIYPNPCSGVLHIEKTEGADHFTICSLDGKIAQSGIIQTSGTIQIENAISGLYIISVFGVNGEAIYTQKILIR